VKQEFGVVILGVLHARMSSRRMPGKVLAPILGEPMIIRQLERLRRARTLDALVVATSRDHGDDPLAAYLAQRGVPVFRGSAEDAVDRCARATEGAEGLTHVARFFCDNPLIDPENVDAAVTLARASGAAYVGSGEHGGVEVIAADALVEAAAQPRDTRDRRDLRFFFGRQADRFARAELDDGAPRWTVDTPGDFAFVRAAYEALHPTNPDFGTQDVLNWLCAREGAGVRPASKAA
jgi:spore coat polysaccharide biosynthesis protein SpsF